MWDNSAQRVSILTTIRYRSVLVLYGSQTGNSESIAKDLNEILLAQDIASSCLTLDEANKLNIKEDAYAVIIGQRLNSANHLICPFKLH